MLTEPSACVAMQSVPGPGTGQSGQTATVSADTSTASNQASGTESSSGGVTESSQTSLTQSPASNPTSVSQSPTASTSPPPNLSVIVVPGFLFALPQCPCGSVDVPAGQYTLQIDSSYEGCLWTRSVSGLSTD